MLAVNVLNRGKESAIGTAEGFWWEVTIDNGDDEGRGSKDCSVGAIIGEEGTEPTVDSWIFVRRVDRNAVWVSPVKILHVASEDSEDLVKGKKNVKNLVSEATVRTSRAFEASTMK